MAVDGVFSVDARALVEVFDWYTERSLRARLTHARMIAIVDIDRPDRFTNHIDQLTIDAQLCHINRTFTVIFANEQYENCRKISSAKVKRY